MLSTSFITAISFLLVDCFSSRLQTTILLPTVSCSQSLSHFYVSFSLCGKTCLPLLQCRTEFGCSSSMLQQSFCLLFCVWFSCKLKSSLTLNYWHSIYFTLASFSTKSLKAFSRSMNWTKCFSLLSQAILFPTRPNTNFFFLSYFSDAVLGYSSVFLDT